MLLKIVRYYDLLLYGKLKFVVLLISVEVGLRKKEKLKKDKLFMFSLDFN
jgi:hypothetical protein